jgi:hypothetical protein
LAVVGVTLAARVLAELRRCGRRAGWNRGSGVFTLATGWDPEDESFEAYLNTIAPERLAEAAKTVGRSKPRQGRYVALETACPQEIDALYEKLLRRLGVA